MIALPLFAIATVVFAEKVYANDKISAPESKLDKKLQNEKALFSQEFFTKVKTDTISHGKNNKSKPERKLVKQDENQPVPPVPSVPLAPDALETPAEFLGGIDLMRRSIAQNFDSSLFEKKTGIISTSIFISVDENGNTTDVKADGEDATFNTEAVRTVKLATNNKVWKPATENGKNVKSVYKIPLKMKFEAPAPTK